MKSQAAEVAAWNSQTLYSESGGHAVTFNLNYMNDSMKNLAVVKAR